VNPYPVTVALREKIISSTHPAVGRSAHTHDFHHLAYFYKAAERAAYHRELQEPAARIDATSPAQVYGIAC